MIADCPNCHAPVEFRFDDSLVRVCEHCHSAVLRTDRGVESLGQFADLVPIESPLRLFADGKDRDASFRRRDGTRKDRRLCFSDHGH